MFSELWFNFVSMVTNWIMGYDVNSLKGWDIVFKAPEWFRCYGAMDKVLGVLAILLAVCLLWCAVDAAIALTKKFKQKRLVSQEIES